MENYTNKLKGGVDSQVMAKVYFLSIIQHQTHFQCNKIALHLLNGAPDNISDVSINVDVSDKKWFCLQILQLLVRWQQVKTNGVIGS